MTGPYRVTLDRTSYRGRALANRGADRHLLTCKPVCAGRDLATGRDAESVIYDDRGLVEAAARELTIMPRERRWTHLSLCVLDAVFSIAAHYDNSTVPTVLRYARWAHLADPVLPAVHALDVIGTDREEHLDQFAARIAVDGPERFAREVLGNGQRTSSRKTSPRKSLAALQYAEILIKHRVRTIIEATELISDDARRPSVEHDLRRVPGAGSNDVRLNYLWMLVGAEEHIKPDRMVLRWLQHVLGTDQPPAPAEARGIITVVADRLSSTPWELDHAIWLAARKVPRRWPKTDFSC